MARRLRVAVQMDPIENINIEANSTFALMLEGQARGHALFHYEVRHMSLHEGVKRPDARHRGERREERLFARARPVTVQRVQGAHYSFGAMEGLDLGTMDVILMRQDPPFDMAYITATHLLEHVQPKTLVVNDPAAVRNAPEKLLVTHFPELMPPTHDHLGSSRRSATSARSTATSSSSRCSATAAPACSASGPTTRTSTSLLEMHFARSREPLMFQRYEPAVRQGDKRIILVDGEPVGAVNRVPAAGEARSNLHVGGRPEKSTLTARDREICAAIGPTLRAQGLIFVGIDVIGDYLTEINVTSPTGIQEIARFDGVHLERAIWDRIEAKVATVPA